MDCPFLLVVFRTKVFGSDAVAFCYGWNNMGNIWLQFPFIARFREVIDDNHARCDVGDIRPDPEVLPGIGVPYPTNTIIERMRSHLTPTEVSFISWNDYVIHVNDEWDATHVREYVMKRLNAAISPSAKELVDACASAQKVETVWGKTVDQITEPRGKPLWADSDTIFLRGKAKAYVDALENVPRLSENTLQNIASLHQVLSHFIWDAEGTIAVLDHLAATQSPITLQGIPRMSKVELPEIPGHAKNAWLGGRYVWTTSVMDGEQGWNFCYNELLRMMGTRSWDIKCHGKSKIEDATFTCTFLMREKAHEGIVSFYETCYKLGLEPNAYVLWDFIPYSFVFDWFCPVGDALHAYTLSTHYTPEFYEYSLYGDRYRMCYTYTETFKSDYGNVEVFARWYESSPPNVESSYFLCKDGTTGDQTTVFRMTDAICLIL